MTSLAITRHAETRMAQRAIRESDLDVLLTHGTDIGQDRIMLKKRDAAELIRFWKKEIARIERLTGKVLVLTEGRLVTAYHETRPTHRS